LDDFLQGEKRLRHRFERPLFHLLANAALNESLTNKPRFTTVSAIMRKTNIKLTKVWLATKQKSGRRKAQLFYCVTWPRSGGGRRRQFFKVKEEAETFLKLKEIEFENFGRAGLNFSEEQRAQYLECVEKIAPFGVTLREAVELALPILGERNRTTTLSELKREFISLKIADGAGERYKEDMRLRLGAFERAFGERPVATLRSEEIDNWLRSRTTRDGQLLAPLTRNNYRRILHTLFAFAVSRNYCMTNPIMVIGKAKVPQIPPGILTPEEAAKLLENADPEVLPVVAIGLFAGLRRSELKRLDWKEIDLTDADLIEIPAQKSKTAQRRFVAIEPNLKAWLQPYARPSGPVCPTRCRRLLESARNAAGITQWPPNAMRHSFASYHLAAFKNAARTSLELGHTDSRITFAHYRELVKPHDAERYWSIMPAARAERIVAFTPS
jgi:integrase